MQPSPTLDHLSIGSAFTIPVNYGKDTISLKRNLDSFRDSAMQEDRPDLVWLYHIRLAEGFSIAFDRINNRTDFHYKRAKSLAEEMGHTELLLISDLREGYYHFVYRDIQGAIPFFLHASELVEKVAMKNVPQVARHMHYMASFYSYIGDYAEAIGCLQRGLAWAEPLSRLEIDMYNSIAVYHRQDKKLPEAKRYFLKAYDIAVAAKDSVWMGIILGNIAASKYKEGHVDEALADIKINIAYSIKFDEKLDAMRSLIDLSQIYIQKGDYPLAKAAVEQALPYIQNKPYFLTYELEIARILGAIAEHENNTQQERIQFKRTILLQDSLAKRENAEQLNRVYWKWQRDRYLNTLEEFEKEKKQIQIYYQFGVVILLLVALIIVLLISRSRYKIATRAARLEESRLKEALEKQQLSEEILVLKGALEDFTNTLKINDILITQLKEEVRKDKITTAIPDEPSLESLLDSHLMTDVRWIKFKALFDRVHDGFLHNSRESNPLLTESDLRILSLEKLELSNRSISDILGISIDGVKKAKQRLRKKLKAP